MDSNIKLYKLLDHLAVSDTPLTYGSNFTADVLRYIDVQERKSACAGTLSAFMTIVGAKEAATRVRDYVDLADSISLLEFKKVVRVLLGKMAPDEVGELLKEVANEKLNKREWMNGVIGEIVKKRNAI